MLEIVAKRRREKIVDRPCVGTVSTAESRKAACQRRKALRFDAVSAVTPFVLPFQFLKSTVTTIGPIIDSADGFAIGGIQPIPALSGVKLTLDRIQYAGDITGREAR